MKREVQNELYNMYHEFDNMRTKLDNFMYGGNEPMPNEDYQCVRAIYDAICKVQDLF